MESGVKVAQRIGSLLSGKRIHVYSRGEGLVQLVKYALFFNQTAVISRKAFENTHTHPIFRQCASKADNSNWISHWLILTNKICCKLQWLSFMHFLWTVEILEINYSVIFKRKLSLWKCYIFRNKDSYIVLCQYYRPKSCIE